MERSDIYICALRSAGAAVEKSELAVFSLFISRTFMIAVLLWTCENMTGKRLSPAT